MAEIENFDNNETKKGIIVIITLIVIFIIVILAWIYIKYTYITKKYKNTLFYRFEEFSKLSVSKLTMTMVIGFLVAAIVNGFNKSIMIPIVQSLFPSEDIWGKGVSLPRGAVMYPGLFFLIVISFFLSLIVVFMIAEMVYQVLKMLSMVEEKYAKIVGVVIFVGLLIGLMVWNIVDLKNTGVVGEVTIPPNIITSSVGRRVVVDNSDTYNRILGISSL